MILDGLLLVSCWWQNCLRPFLSFTKGLRSQNLEFIQTSQRESFDSFMEPLPSCVIFKLATAKLVMTSKPFFPQMLQCLFVSVQILLPNNPEVSMALPKRLGGGGGMCFLVFYSRQHFQRSFSSSALIKKLRSAKSGTVHVWRRKWTDRIKKI